MDKTNLIAFLIDNPSMIHLITRPRRFGKTLNLSMIRYFFETPTPGRISDSSPNGYLFETCSIRKHPRYGEFQGQYPVIALNFKNVKSSSYRGSINMLKRTIAEEYRRHEKLLHILDNDEKKLFASIRGNDAPDEAYASAIYDLSAWLERACGKKVYILLDEYDTPLHSAYSKDYYDEMIDFIRSFMVQTFKDNPHLKQAVMVGILKVAQESIFSDFNNPKVSTLLEARMEDCFGFTEPEVEAMAVHFGLEKEMSGIKKWYNGYIFGSSTVIYNPWSIVSYLDSPQMGFRPYWINTSDNAMIRDILRLDTQEGRETIEQLLAGKEVRKEIISSIAYPQIETRQDAVWSFLLHSGYLRAEDRRQHTYMQDYRIVIPNRELHYIFNTIITNWLAESLKVNEDFLAFIRGIRETDTALIERSLSRILKGLASFHDTGRNADEEEIRKENFYHGLVLGLLAYLEGEYIVESNRECGEGRPDIVLIKHGRKPGTYEDVFVFEFKQEPASGKTALSDLAREAYKQIEAKYRDAVRAKWKPAKLLLLGVGFRGKDLVLNRRAE